MMKNAKKYTHKMLNAALLHQRLLCLPVQRRRGRDFAQTHDRRMRLKFIIQKASWSGERQGFQLLQLQAESARTHLQRGPKNAYASKWQKLCLQDYSFLR
jgi:hypothetical protein